MTWNEKSEIKSAIVEYIRDNHAMYTSPDKIFDLMCITPGNDTLYYHFDVDFPSDDLLKEGIGNTLQAIGQCHSFPVVREPDRMY